MRLSKPASEMSFEDDCLQLNSFADQFERYLQVDHLFVPGSLVVGLEAPFGSGKTAFLAMWSKRLRQRLDDSPDGPMPVLLNAWEDDFVGDPLLSIVLSLVSELEQLKGLPARDLSGLKNAAKKVVWFGVGLANNFVSSSTGIDPLAAGKLAEEKSAKPEASGEKLFELYRARKESLTTLKQELKSLLGDEDKVKAIICIDELDRCRPDYAIEYLETIKHVFDIPGIVFVLAIDKEQVSNSAKALFGSDLNANEYLRKFIARSFHLPKPDENGIRAMVQSFYERFMVVENVRDSEFREGYLLDRATELCVAFDFTLRQIEDFFRLLGHVFSSEEPTGRMYSSWLQGYLFLCSLKTRDSKFYRDFCNGNVGIPDLIHVLKQRMHEGNVERWACLCYTGMHKDSKVPRLHEYLSQEGLVDTDSIADTRLEDHYAQHWGDSHSNCILRIFNQIESAASI